MHWHEADALKRDLERLRLEFNLEKGERERATRTANEARNGLENAQREIAELKGALQDATTSSTAQLLALASTRLTGLLGALAHDEATTISKLEAIVEKLPSRTISTSGSPYLTRWYLWPEGPRDVDDEGSDLPFAMFLHKFHRGDADRDQHNHPWDLSVAIVLAGGYHEERGDAVHIHLPGSINIIRGDDFHRVDLLNPVMGSWSLFVAGRKTSGWGFRDKTTSEFIPWKDYLAVKGTAE